MKWRLFYKDCFGHTAEERRTTWDCIILMLVVTGGAWVLL